MVSRVSFWVLAMLLLFQASIMAQIKPKRLAVYYAWPTVVNQTYSVSGAAAEFADYDVVILGAWLHLQQHVEGTTQATDGYNCSGNAHPDHDNTVDIITEIAILNPSTEVYGYVSIGGANTERPCGPLSDQQITTAIDQWKAMGVTGIFFDEAGNDFGTTPARRNMAAGHARSTPNNLKVFFNAWNSDDIAHVLQSGDIIMLESYQIMPNPEPNDYEDPTDWKNRADKALNYKNTKNVEVATVTRTLSVSSGPDLCNFDQSKFDYAWWSTFIYGFDYMGWGEPEFSADDPCNGKMPFRSPLFTCNAGSTFTSNSVTHIGNVHTRNTDAGVITVNTSTHTGQFSDASSDPISFWNFNEASGNALDAFGGNDGILNGNATRVSTHVTSGSSILLDGNGDYVDVLQITPYDMECSDFSFEAWIRPENLQTPHTPRVIMGRYNSHPMFYMSLNNPMKIVARIAFSSAAGKDISTTQGFSLNPDQWYHVVTVYDRDANMTIYVNGQQYGQPVSITGLQGDNLVSDKNRLRMGASGAIANPGQFFQGQMDNVAVYKRALTLTEIQQKHLAGHP